MKRRLLFLVLILGVAGCALPGAGPADRPAYSAEEVQGVVTETLVGMRPPIADIYYYGMYHWELTTHRIGTIEYAGNGEWQVYSEATFHGYHNGLSVGTDTCALHWRFSEKDGRAELVGNDLLAPRGAPPAFSRAEVADIVGDHLGDIYYDLAPLNWHENSHWKLTYLGDGMWEVRAVISNAVGLWRFDEKTEDVEFLGRLGP